MNIIDALSTITIHLNKAQAVADQLEKQNGVRICKLNNELQFSRGIEQVTPFAEVSIGDTTKTTNGSDFKKLTAQIGNIVVIQLARFIDGEPVFETAVPVESEVANAED